jgi:hypothetical protein
MSRYRKGTNQACGTGQGLTITLGCHPELMSGPEGTPVRLALARQAFGAGTDRHKQEGRVKIISN